MYQWSLTTDTKVGHVDSEITVQQYTGSQQSAVHMVHVTITVKQCTKAQGNYCSQLTVTQAHDQHCFR